MMRSRLIPAAILIVIACCLQTARPAVAQDGEQTDPMAELLTELGEVEARIGFLEARYEIAEGEDRELFADQLGRRWREHHALLGEMAAATEAAREAGAERLDATERLRTAITREFQFLRTYGDTLQARIAALRLVRPDTPPEDLTELELQLTDLNIALDRLSIAATDEIEWAESVGLDLGTEVAFLDSAIGYRAAIIAARIELASDQKVKLLDRAGKAGADTVAIHEELNALEEKLFGTTTSLETMIELMDRRGLESSDYRRLLLETTGDFGTDILDVDVVGGILQDRWAALRTWLADNIGSILIKLLTIIGVVFLFGIFARLGRRATRRILASAHIDTSELLNRLLIGGAGKLVWLLGFLVVLSILGVDLGPMLAGLGIAGFIIGFALQDTLSNFASGLMIMLYRPFDVGDIVTVGGVSGHVQAVTLVSTVIMTFDNQAMIVPNSKVWGDVINNVTAQDTRRVDLVFGIGYADDIPKAQAIISDVVRSHDLVLDDPEPIIRVHNLGESSVDFVCRPWCRTDDYWTVHWDVTEAVKQRFDAEGVSIPFPQRDVHIYQHGAAATEPEAT